ncbi:MAG TPA: PadR family transcriptional regulator [Mycobacteriales bacterium]|jgi:DNA-binding PadR family transcriptional regulator|nr:PadR family transcriptional regulator [Mycobacteriales bacterium]
MARRKVSNPLALAVLACLAERPMHPYEMATIMRERGKHESIKLNYGSLYSVVESLQKHGLIAPKETVKDGRRPERTVYEITPPGRLEFVDWLGELIGTPAKEYPAFEAGLSMIGGLPPDAAVSLLQQRAAQLRSQQQAAREMQRYAADLGVPHLFLIEADYRHSQIQAEIEFVEKLAASIADSSLDGVAYWREAQRRYAAGEEVEPLRLPSQS